MQRGDINCIGGSNIFDFDFMNNSVGILNGTLTVSKNTSFN